MIRNSVSKIYNRALLSSSLLYPISISKFCEVEKRGSDKISPTLKEKQLKTGIGKAKRIFNPKQKNELDEKQPLQPEITKEKEIYEVNHVFDQSILEDNNRLMLDLIEQNKLSFEDSSHNNEFCDFLELFEKFMQSSNTFRKDLGQASFEINNLVVNGRKPLNEIIDIYFNFANKYGFEPRLLTETFIGLSEVVVNRRATNGPAYFDYSDYELVFSRKLYHLVDDLKYGITQSRSFLSYTQIEVCLKCLRNIGYKNTELLEMILQRVEYDVSKKVLMEFGAEHTDIPMSVFEKNCFDKSYKEKNGFWPGEGKLHYHHYYNAKMELSKHKKFDEFLVKLMKIKTESNDEQLLNHSKNNKSYKQEEESADIDDDIAGLLEALKTIKSTQLSIVDSVKSIVEQFEKIKHFFINNQEYFKSNVQVRYNFLFLQNKLAQLGFNNLDLADPSRKLIIDSTVKMLKEFAALEFPELFNLEVEKISKIVDEAVGERNFRSNNNTLNSLNHLNLLLNELTAYSKVRLIDVNKHDFINSKFFNFTKQLGDETLNLNDSADQTISSKLNEKWLEKIVASLTNSYLQGHLAINNFHNAISLYSILKLSSTIMERPKVEQALHQLLNSNLLKDDIIELSQQYVNSVSLDINRPSATNIVYNMRQLASLIQDSDILNPQILNNIFEKLVIPKVETDKNQVENLIILLSIMIKFDNRPYIDIILNQLENVHALEVSIINLSNQFHDFLFAFQYIQLYLQINKISSRLTGIDISKQIKYDDIVVSALNSYYSASCKGNMTQLTEGYSFPIRPNFIVGYLGYKVAVFTDYIYPGNYYIQNSTSLSYLLSKKGLYAIFINPKKFIEYDGNTCSLISSKYLVPLHEEIVNELTILKEKNPELGVNIRLTQTIISAASNVTKELESLYNKINKEERITTSRAELKLIIQRSKELVQLIENMYSSFNPSMLRDVILKIDSILKFFKKVDSKELIAKVTASLEKLVKEANTYVSLISLDTERSSEPNTLSGMRLGISTTKKEDSHDFDLINLKFLWHNKYAVYEDWKLELQSAYDKFNYNEISNSSKFYFGNKNRLVPQAIIPDPSYFREIIVNEENKNLSLFQRNSKLKEQFSNITDDLKLKVNLLNITHHIKTKKSNREIVSFITSFDFIEKLKLEKIEEMKSKLPTSGQTGKLLRRDENAYADFIAELEIINPSIDDFSRTALLEEENSADFLKYEPSMNYIEREDYLVDKFEKWLEINTDTDSLSENANRVHYKFKTDTIKQVIQKIQIEAKEKVHEILSRNKLQLLFENRILSERNLILMSIANKLNEKSSVRKPDSKLLSETDLEFLRLISNQKEESTNTISRLNFKDLSSQDVAKLESLGNSISLANHFQDFSLNELIFELSNFIDQNIASKFLEDLQVGDNEFKKSNKILREKVDHFNLQAKLESAWARQLQLNNEGKQTILDMYFINKNSSKFEKAWVPSTTKYLTSKIEQINNEEDSLINLNSLIRKSDREFYDLIYWPHQVDKSMTTIEKYDTVKSAYYLDYLEKRIGKKKEELKNDNLLLSQFVKKFLEVILADLVESFKTIEGLRLCFYDILSKDQIDLIEMMDQELKITETLKNELYLRLSKTDMTIKLEKNADKDLMSSFAKVELPAIHLVQANKKI